MKQKKILFVSSGGGHVNMLIPVIKAITRKYKHVVHPVVIGITEAKSALESAGIETLSMYDFITKNSKEALSRGKKLINDKRYSHLPYTETIAYLGLSYINLVEDLGEEDAKQLYLNKGLEAFLPIKLMHAVLRYLKPALVVSTNAGGVEQATFMAATTLGIPSVCLVDFFAQNTPWIFEKGYASKFCVFADFNLSELLQHGHTQNDIIVTGNPGFDSLFAMDIDFHAERVRFRKNWRKKKILLWDYQPEPKYHPTTGEPGDPHLPKEITLHLAKIIERHPEWQLVIRQHPNLTSPFKELPKHVEFTSRYDYLPFLLRAVDAVIIFSSRVGLQAALIGKDVYQIGGSILYEDLPLSELGYAKEVSHFGQFEDIFFNKNKVKKSLYPFHESTPRVIATIMDLLQISGLIPIFAENVKSKDVALLSNARS